MSFVDTYKQRVRGHTARESIDTLDHIGDYFQDGTNWTQDMYQRGNARCLVGAADHVRVSSLDNAKYWLLRAIAEIAPEVRTIEQFNDTRSTFDEVAAVIARARQLAAAEQRQLQAQRTAPVRALPAPVLEGEILPPVREALPLVPVVEARPVVQRAPAPVSAPRPSLAGWRFD
jgi:hypothetical protein